MKKLIAFLLAGVIAFAGSGCSEDKEATKKILHLSCWIEDAELDQLISLFENNHPDVSIEVKAYYSEDQKNVDAAMERMNADMIVDEDVDLYYLENAIDVQSLITAGLITNLYSVMDKDELVPENLYYTNVLDAMETENCLYELPAGFEIAGIAGSESFLAEERTGWTIEEFNSFVSSQSDPENVLPLSQSTMLSLMSSYTMFDYVDLAADICNFNTDSFERWLEFIKCFPESPGSAAKQAAKTYAGWFSGISECVYLRELLHDAVKFVGFPCDSAPGPCIEELITFGISSHTMEQGLCVEFLKTALSKEYQEIIAKSSFPMMKAVFENQLEEATLPYTDEKSLFYGDASAQPFTQGEVNYFRNLVESLSVLRFRYQDVTDIVCEEAESYFADDKDVKQVANLIQNRVSIYLAEQQ